LSETLSYTTLEEQQPRELSEAGVDERKPDGLEIKDPTWGGSLTDLVRENAHVIVQCSWLGGAEVSLGEAMNSYPFPPNMTPADEPLVVAVVLEMLANPVVEETDSVEESSEEFNQEDEETDSESGVGEEEQKSIFESNPEGSDKAELQVDLVETVESSAGLTEGANSRPSNDVLTADAEPSSEGTIKQTPNRQAPKPKKETVELPNPPVIDKKQPPSAEFKLVKTLEKKEKQTPHELKDVRSQDKNLYEKSKPRNGLSHTESNVLDKTQFKGPLERAPQNDNDSAVIEEQVNNVEQTVTSDAPAPISEVNINKATVEDKPALIIENEIIEDETELEFTFQKEIGLSLETTDEPMIEKLDLPEIDETIGEFEEELVYFDVTDRVEVDQPEFIQELEQVQIETESAYSEKTINEINIEAVEYSLVSITESIGEAETAKTQELNEILDRITEIPALLEQRDENNLTEQEAQEELEELFCSIFIKLGIEYSPTLIEDLVYLTLRCQLTEEITKLKLSETEDLPQAVGTHEIIKKILVGLSKIKKALSHAYALGSSALRLCNLEFSS
jgi:hypothetical protein